MRLHRDEADDLKKLVYEVIISLTLISNVALLPLVGHSENVRVCSVPVNSAEILPLMLVKVTSAATPSGRK
jgi:hypothetical protein